MYVNVTNEQKPLHAHRRTAIFSFRDPAEKNRSGVLFGAQVTLVFEPFLTHAALVVIPVGRGIWRDAVLLRRVGTDRWIARAAGWTLIALRMARRATQCGMSHGLTPPKEGRCPTGVDRTASH
jgi:hypothetical protein